MGTKAVAFRAIFKVPFEVKTGDIFKNSKVTSIKSVKCLSHREVEVIGMCKEVESK